MPTLTKTIERDPESFRVQKLHFLILLVIANNKRFRTCSNRWRKKKCKILFPSCLNNELHILHKLVFNTVTKYYQKFSLHKNTCAHNYADDIFISLSYFFETSLRKKHTIFNYSSGNPTMIFSTPSLNKR